MSEEQGQGENQGNQGTGEESKPELKSFTDEQLKSMMSREKKEGRQAAEKAIAEELGKPIAEVKALLKAAEEAEEAKKSELDKLREENEGLKKSKDSETSESKREAHDEKVKRALVRSGLPLPEDDEEAEKVLTRVSRLVDLQPGATAEEIRESVKGMKETAFPQLWKASEGSEEPKPKPGTPGSLPSGTPTRKPALGESSSEKAKRLAEERNKARGVIPTNA